MKTLLEGMRQGDLEDLVLPLLSLDEFVSKIDDDAIVIAFFGNERGAADDLNRFLQRSPIDILDTEVSPAPDSHGYYMVFVELLNNAKLPDNVEGLLEEVASLTNIESWKLKTRGTSELVAFSTEAVAKAIEPPARDEVRESVLEFLTNSDLLDARFEADKLVLECGGHTHEFSVVAFDEGERVVDAQNLTEAVESLTLADTMAARTFAAMLGPAWAVHRFSQMDLLQNCYSSKVLLLAR